MKTDALCYYQPDRLLGRAPYPLNKADSCSRTKGLINEGPGPWQHAGGTPPVKRSELGVLPETGLEGGRGFRPGLGGLVNILYRQTSRLPLISGATSSGGTLMLADHQMRITLRRRVCWKRSHQTVGREMFGPGNEIRGQNKMVLLLSGSSFCGRDTPESPHLLSSLDVFKASVERDWRRRVPPSAHAGPPPAESCFRDGP
ncbi:unnamed protein product [Boreogadus saida]